MNVSEEMDALRTLERSGQFPTDPQLEPLRCPLQDVASVPKRHGDFLKPVDNHIKPVDEVLQILQDVGVSVKL